MGWKCIIEIKPQTGLNLAVPIANMLYDLPGENLMIVGNVLHKYHRECGLKITQLAPTRFYKKYKSLWPRGTDTNLMRILNSVSGNTHFVFVYGGTLPKYENFNHKVYMRTL